MTGWVLRIVAVGTLVGAQVQGVVHYVESLPPRPEQTQVACRDAAWEAANLASVEESRLHKKLVPFTKNLLTEARSQGVPLTINVGYRSCEYQLNLRKLNCGLGDYNLYQKPSSECTPPTEPAGKSLHNEGLAIDFSCHGYALIETSPCLKWLQANASKYHLYKHSIEAWHWSTTGK